VSKHENLEKRLRDAGWNYPNGSRYKYVLSFRHGKPVWVTAPADPDAKPPQDALPVLADLCTRLLVVEWAEACVRSCLGNGRMEWMVFLDGGADLYVFNRDGRMERSFKGGDKLEAAIRCVEWCNETFTGDASDVTLD
jgi:hypothetical protein